MTLIKSVLLIALCSVFSARTIAQPVVTSSDMLVVGDTIINYIADTDNVDYGTGGANKTWDYSGLRLQNSLPDSLVTVYLAPSNTPYFSNFPKANVCGHLVGQYTYDYFRYDNSTSTAWEIGFSYGTSSDPVIETYDQPALVSKFPINSAYNATDNYSSTQIANGYTSYRKGSVTMEADGYGTLKLPRNTYSNVLRIHTHTIDTDSSYYQGSFLDKGAIITDGYSYLVPGIKNTLLSISRDDQYSSGQHLHGSKHVIYYDRAKPHVVKENNYIDGSLRVFPNPVQNQCTLIVESTKNVTAVISVINMLEQVVGTYSNLSLTYGSNSFTIDMSTYQKGCYFVRLESEGQSACQKVLVQ
jgi:hypothetical protein